MSANNKRCSSGTTSMTRTQSFGSLTQVSTLSRSKTCGVTGTVSVKPKAERLQPLPANKNSQLNDETLVKVFSSLFHSIYFKRFSLMI